MRNSLSDTAKPPAVIQKVEYLFLILASFSVSSAIGCKVLTADQQFKGWRQRGNLLTSRPVWNGGVGGKPGHGSFTFSASCKWTWSFGTLLLARQRPFEQ